MIGNFYPAVIVAFAGFVFSPAVSPINIRATSAATEIANDVEWLNVYR